MPSSIISVIGNGPGDLSPEYVACPCVTFNQATHHHCPRGEIRVMNRKLAGQTSTNKPFAVTSSSHSRDWCQKLQQALSEAEKHLEPHLGCMPSTGLATIYALSQMGFSLQIYRMPLQPCLHRPPGLSPRTPLPAAFHNWLGERRFAWEEFRKSPAISFWPQLGLPGVDKLTAAAAPEWDPFHALTQWFAYHAGHPQRNGAAELIALAELSPAAWIPLADTITLRSLEKYFFLDRRRQYTPNWWLYDNELSRFIDVLLLRLMQAQQSWFVSAASSQAIHPGPSSALP